MCSERETAVLFGTEQMAHSNDFAVVFFINRKVKRGYYEATIELMTEDAKSIPNFEISEAFMKKVEQQIHEAPEFYLWTHKRWKHGR